MKNILFTADLHFTDLPRDEYRWGLLPWLAKMCRQYKVDLVVLGGDITDAKDKHSSVLVNRLVAGLKEIAEEAPVFILRGNHDYIDEGQPFFGFTEEIHSKYEIMFLTKPAHINRQLYLPNTKNWEKEWNDFGWARKGPEAPEVIFTHATFDGCESESGFKLSGIPPSFFNGGPKVWSGDIHKPQKVGKNIEYVGAPYRVRFGDAFKPRVVLLECKHSEWQSTDLHYKCEGKHLIDIINPQSPKDAALRLRRTHETGGLTIYEGDQVKIRVKLPRHSYPEWPAIKAALIEEAAAAKLKVTGPELVAMDLPAPKKASKHKDTAEDTHSPFEALAAYAEEKAVPADLQDAGERYLKKVIG